MARSDLGFETRPELGLTPVHLDQSEDARRDDRLRPERRRRFPTQRDRQADRLAQKRAAAGRHQLPYSLLIGLAKPLKEALNVPIVCTLQGEDLFLDGLSDPYRKQALDLIRSQVQNVDGFLAVSEYYADFMPRYLAFRAKRSASCRWESIRTGLI